MRIFVYEFLTGGGLLHAGGTAADFDRCTARAPRWSRRWPAISPPCPMSQSRSFAMADRRSYAAAGCLRVRVTSARSERLAFARAAAEADWTVVIAPESNGWLVERCELVVASGGRLLGTSGRALEIASDKHTTAEYLRAAGVAAPARLDDRRRRTVAADVHYPAVIKPRDGAGSQGVRLVLRHRECLPSPGAYSPGKATQSPSPRADFASKNSALASPSASRCSVVRLIGSHCRHAAKG